MEELILYAVLFLLLIGHTLLAGKMYRKVHENSSLTIQEKNDWKLKALIFPGYFWFQYQKSEGKSS
ncbi:hypothetical protein E4S40_06765 [Algoriphagus kandeliae]|uniref:Uncharacterized protein n=1 Tax=Algoriphagus kandeliae TaxID=2562278 RepID=A0A4Y9QTU5_9BACT|nr:hypothetical protein [Algoriphagus kandeliae]TFV95919.1 hypothetical protein E4S40_06765 [Algoriphagus kandeliae]